MNKYPFTKAKDARGHDVRGLWVRNGRYYAQMHLPGKSACAKIPLLDPQGKPLETVAQARDRLNELKQKREQNIMPPIRKTSTLGEWIETYLDWLTRTKTKNELTIKKETHTLRRWAELCGAIRLAHLQRSHVNDFVAIRKEEGVSNRTVNLDVIALNNCLNHARHEGLIQGLPTENWQALEHVAPRRPLWTEAQIDLVCEKALEIEKQKQEEEKRFGCGQMLADFLRFLMFSGARRNEAIHVKWSDVNWERRFVSLNKTKYGQPRDVDFNERLEKHLKEMQTRRQPDSEWIFPSPRRGDEDAHIFTLQNTLYPARDAVGLPDFCFHDLRHYFISTCVMAGIDFMTIARWVGHKDGGILIGKVYGKLNDEHSKKMAAKAFSAPLAPAPATIDAPALLAQLQAQNAMIQQLIAGQSKAA